MKVCHRRASDFSSKGELAAFRVPHRCAMEKRGYDCYRTPGTNDNGVDVVAIDGNRGQLIQVKTSGIYCRKLGWGAVKEVVAGEALYRRRRPDVSFEKVCVTN